MRKLLLLVIISILAPFFMNAQSTTPSADKFLILWNKIHDPANHYFSPEGAPYHSIETLMVEAPDQGHETTSEAYSYWLWIEAMYGKVSGDWSYFRKAWTTMEAQIIPSQADQPSADAYNPSKPATYAAEYPLPNNYPSQLRTEVPVGVDPISAELTNTYGSAQVYGMHWLLDADNFYGYGNRADGVGKPSYINTFQRGEQESTWETIPQPSWEAFKWGGPNGFLDLFTKDSSGYSKQWRYTDAPDADARAIQAMFWAYTWVKQQGKDPAVELPIAKAKKMGDYLRLAMFDKYFKPIGVQSESAAGASGYDSAHYLMSWYYAWGGSLSASNGWAWRISSSHAHFGYQNPLTAWVLSTNPDFKPTSPNAARDWAKSLTRQLEFYQWLQSAEGAIAGGATNSYNGNYSAYPAGTATFYNMAYVQAPVYNDPPSNQWFGMQAWSMERMAEYYYETNNATAKTVLDKWIAWVKTQVSLPSDGLSYSIPSELAWTGQPQTWNPAAPAANANLHVSVISSGQDVGVTGSLVKALLYYAKAKEKWTGSVDAEARDMGKQLLDRMWSLYSDSEGIAVPESRKDYTRFFDPIFVPTGWTGVMPNGDKINSSSRFIDIRTKYLADPEYMNFKQDYDAGKTHTATYHRFWAQSDIALGFGVYAALFEAAMDSSLSITNAIFDKAMPADIVVNLTLNANTFSGITGLLAGSDYTVSGTTVTVKKEYLASKAAGNLVLIFTFSAGTSPTLTVSIVDSSIQNSTINPVSASFDKATPSPVAVIMTLNGNSLIGLTGLTLGSDYTVSGSTVSILSSYLQKQATGSTATISFSFSAGTNATIAISIKDSSVVPSTLKFEYYNANRSDSSNTIAGSFRVTNTGSSPINLATVKMHYYFTKDGAQNQNFWCDYAYKNGAGYESITSSVVGSFVTATGTNADTALELTFAAAGTLSPGGVAEMQIRVAKTDWTNYSQSNDYSFNPTASSFVQSTKLIGYVDGVKVYGTEP